MYLLKPLIFSFYLFSFFSFLTYLHNFAKSLVIKQWSTNLPDTNTQSESSFHSQSTTKQAVKCFDTLWHERLKPLNHKNKFTKLNFFFVGDSRIRQQFYSFLKYIPDYDRKTRPHVLLHNSPHFHGDSIEVESNILRLRVTFQWRPTINDTVMETIQRWTTSAEVKRPDLIFLGMATHFMLRMNGSNYQLFQERIRELGSVLEKLSNFSKVIWFNQYPIVEFFGESDSQNTDVYSEKVHNYNKAVRRIFKRYSGIHIWDVSNPLAEEYVRSCVVAPGRFTPVYFDCLDYIHTGYAALLQATQLFYNEMCNFPARRTTEL